MELCEKVLEFLGNKCKQQRFKVINDIPRESLPEYERISKSEAQKADGVYNFFR